MAACGHCKIHFHSSPLGVLIGSQPSCASVPNAREEEVARRYEGEGWKVLRGGAPDFLMLRVEEGQILEVKAVEVKGPGSELTYEQAVYRRILERAGLEYVVEVITG